VPVDVVCSITANPTGCPIAACTRQETLLAYPQTQCTSTSCSGNPYVQGVVIFDDYTSNNINDCTPSGAQTTCGSTMTIYTWVVENSLTT
jgi:hypothetical protein